MSKSSKEVAPFHAKGGKAFHDQTGCNYGQDIKRHKAQKRGEGGLRRCSRCQILGGR